MAHPESTPPTPARIPPDLTPPGTDRLPGSRGKTILVDGEDYLWLMCWKWSINNRDYAHRNHYYQGVPRKLLLHRFILHVHDRPWQEALVDHRNGDRLDNRRANLRLVDRGTNGRNSHTPVRGKSGVRNVFWHQGRWRLRIRVNGRSIDVGAFDTLEEARLARGPAIERFETIIEHPDRLRPPTAP